MAEWLIVKAECEAASPAAPTAHLPPAHLPARRPGLAFRAVNARSAPGFDPGLQRHHLLPRQLLHRRCFGPLFDQLGRGRVGFDDFRSNGLLLPASEVAAMRIGLPLHRGPHRDYNAMVIERVGGVEADWARLRLRAPEVALANAAQQLRLLQQALRHQLLDAKRTLRLNRHDPLGHAVDFAALDAMADSLWPATAQPATAQPATAQPEGGAVTGFQPAKGAVAAARSAFAW